jgi:hypothetical protein
MPIYNLFSKRMKAKRGEFPDVYQYDNFDRNLKIKIIYIIKDYFGDDLYGSEEYYKIIINILCKEYGQFSLTNKYNNNYEHLFKYFLDDCDTDRALDVVELCFKLFEASLKDTYNQSCVKIVDDMIYELNVRFKEEGFGYKYESGMIMKITDEFTHNEVIKPVLKLLSDSAFKGAEEEFLSAHLHYRKSENKECITDCLKAFESTMKIICKKKKYQIKDNPNAKDLISKLFEEKYIPLFLQSNFTSLQSLMESGVPTIRNRLSAHGQGDKDIDPDSNITEYVIHLTASNILFLINLL